MLLGEAFCLQNLNVTKRMFAVTRIMVLIDLIIRMNVYDVHCATIQTLYYGATYMRRTALYLHIILLIKVYNKTFSLANNYRNFLKLVYCLHASQDGCVFRICGTFVNFVNCD